MSEREQGNDPTPDLREERLRQLVQAAYPAGEPDEALARRVAALVAEHRERSAGPRRARAVPAARRPSLALAAAALLAALGWLLVPRAGRQPLRSAPQVARVPTRPANSAASRARARARAPARKSLDNEQEHEHEHEGGSVAQHAGDDMAYVNRDPEQAFRPWLAPPPDPRTAIEARARRQVRSPDDFITVPFPLLASTAPRQIAAAVASYQREVAIVDPRLSRPVTLALKGASLDDVCAALKAQTGISFRAARGVGDDKVTVFVDRQPVRRVMRALVQLLGDTWRRSGGQASGGTSTSRSTSRSTSTSRSRSRSRSTARTPERRTPEHLNTEFRYELEQDLRAQLAVAGLRQRDLSAALLAVDREVQADRPYLDQSVPELQQRLARASGPERDRLFSLVGLGGWVGVELYDRLTPAERAALLNGQPLLFSPDAPDPDHRLPAAWVRPILQSVNPPQPPGRASVSLADTPGVTLSTAGIQLDRSDLGQVFLDVTLDTQGPKAGQSGHSRLRLATGAGPSKANPDNAAANRALRGQARFTRQVSLRPEPSCAARWGAKVGRQEPSPWVMSADVWEALHRATGQQIVADFYTRLYPAAAVTVEKAPLFEALCRVGDALGVRWRLEDDLLLARSTRFFWDELQEVPNRDLQHWQQAKQANGGLPLDSLLEMAALSDDQLNASAVGQAIVQCWGLDEWHVVASMPGFPGRRSHPEISPDIPSVVVRTATSRFPWLTQWHWYPGDLRAEVRFFASLTPAQRRRALQPEGVAFAELNPTQQRGFLQLWEQVEALQEQHSGRRRGLDPRQLVNARFSAEYIPAGWYYWQPPYAPPQPRPRLLPRVAGRTAAAALAAARRVDPAARPEQIQLCPDGQFVPSLWIGAND